VGPHEKSFGGNDRAEAAQALSPRCHIEIQEDRDTGIVGGYMVRHVRNDR